MNILNRSFKYHASATHWTSDVLRMRFAAIDPLWNKAPRKRKVKKPVNVIPIEATSRRKA